MDDAVSSGARDLSVPHVDRPGGVTRWIRTAGMADRREDRGAPDVMPDFGAHMLAATSSGQATGALDALRAVDASDLCGDCSEGPILMTAVKSLRWMKRRRFWRP